MSELRSSGRNPQTSGGFTNWTVIGSVCDLAVSETSAIDMNASHAVVYSRGFEVEKFKQKCYDHGQALHDNNLKQDAHLYNCSTVDPDNSPCGTEYKDKKGNPVGNWKYTENGLRGLSQLYYSITGRLPSGAERVGSSRHLWLLSTAATAWALLRR